MEWYLLGVLSLKDCVMHGKCCIQIEFFCPGRARRWNMTLRLIKLSQAFKWYDHCSRQDIPLCQLLMVLKQVLKEQNISVRGYISCNKWQRKCKAKNPYNNEFTVIPLITNQLSCTQKIFSFLKNWFAICDIILQGLDGFHLSRRETNVLRLTRLVKRRSKKQYMYRVLLEDHFTNLKITKRHIKPERGIKEKKLNGSLELLNNVLLGVQKPFPYLTEKAM